ncbi:hypothetical protein QYE76_047422 [Lolium multiflorum]|uniref:RNase H type-1 domain-containing protein n=1 Tax=Lolium multiflorum TaxID=4521 RepID=A0AAD8TNT3_LOLMU|nr:hypothetical protein QYE76_047422 [Lolium multiflorum]
MENYSLLMGDSSVDEDGGGDGSRCRWRSLPGHFPVPAACRNRDSVPRSWLRDGGGSDGFSYRGFSEIKVVLSVKIPSLHPATWAIDIIDSNKVDPRVAAIILCGGWAVWAERNARDHGESTRSIAQSVKWTTDITRDLAESIRVKTSGHPKRRSKWRRPEEGVIKVNVDAGFDLNNGEGSSGLIVRDHDGALLRGQAIWYSHGANSLTMEALAVRDGVNLANDLGIPRIEVETDASEVVKLWNERRQGRSEIWSILQEIEELSSNMESFQLGYIGREANEGAHLCAKQASASRRRCLWINYIPTFLVQCLQNDCKPDE